MIERDWNHPSIVLWGVRINESRDDHDFYAETNRVAHALDTTRQTGGIRVITESELLEDVYTTNDFILGNEELGGNRPRTPLRPRRETSGLDRPVPYMVTEFNGHMYPTKSYDQEQRQIEHVTRHLEVLNAAYGDPEIAGCIGWCAFDYNTHKDFGSGDRICHHGVMDMFREPKFAAFAYASQCEPAEAVVLEPVTFWARGERNIGGVLPLMVLTNCEEVELRYGNNAPKRARAGPRALSRICRMRRSSSSDTISAPTNSGDGACCGKTPRSPASSAASRWPRSTMSPIRWPRSWRSSPTARRSRPRRRTACG